MSGDVEDKEANALLKFPRDCYAYLLGPLRFLSRLDLARARTLKRARDSFLLGMTGAVAFSVMNLSISPLYTEENRRLLEGPVVAMVMLLGCVTMAMLAYILSRLLGGRGTLRDTLVIFGFTFGFLMPAMFLLLIIVSHLAELTLGLPWTELPPLDIPLRSGIPPTVGSVLVVALYACVLLWGMGYYLYCFGCAVSVSQRLNLSRCAIVTVLTAVFMDLLNSNVVAAARLIGTNGGPVIDWIIRLW